VISADVQSKALSLGAAKGNHTQQIDIPKEDQDIAFTAPVDPDVDESATLTATSSAGLRVDLTLDPTSDACRLDGHTVTYLHARDCTITASQSGNRDYRAAAPVARTFTVAKGIQTISFTPPADATVGDDSTLHATSSSGATVSFDQGTSDNGACTVSGTAVSFDHARDCTVTMGADATDDYQALTDVTGSFPIAKGTPHFTFVLPATGQVQGGDELTASSSDSDGEIAFSVDQEKQVCTLNQTHTTVRYHQVGACTVTATLSPTDDYLGATIDQTVTIVGLLSIDPPVVKTDLGLLLGYHHVKVTVNGVVSPATAALTASSGQTGDILAVGPECGSILFPARSCSVTDVTQTFDWYVNLHGARWADVTFTAATTDGQTASRQVRVDAWNGEQ
jgi:hypothetical protein